MLLALLLLASACGSVTAQVYEKVFSFTDANTAALMNTGGSPSTLVLGRDGNFYGTTGYGGANNVGSAFKMTPSGVLTTLVNFTSSSGQPVGPLILGSDGNFYGSTSVGIYKMTPAGVLTMLAASVSGNLIQGNDGNFYGTSSGGGAYGDGYVFEMTPEGNVTTLIDFTGYTVGIFGIVDSNRGSQPGPLVQGTDGNFYGTTSAGGANGAGTAFKITPGNFFLTTLVDFTNNTDTSDPNRGAIPRGALIQGNDGNLYGTTSAGGANSLGTVFQMTPAGVLTTLVDFTGNGASNRGAQPNTGLIQGGDGNFYGTTSSGGANGSGTAFKMTSGGGLTNLVDFTNSGAGNPGSGPSGLVQGTDGNFYGTTGSGGSIGFGTAFKMTPTGVITVLLNFSGYAPTTYGFGPKQLTLASDGNLYGTTEGGGVVGGSVGNGTAYKISPPAALTQLLTFTYNGTSNRGANPGSLVQVGGIFYGTTSTGGANGDGTIFKMTSAGVLTTLIDFTGNGTSNRGATPNCLIHATDGNFYGTTAGGGVNGDGTVFKMTSAGVLTTLVDFTGIDGNSRGTTPNCLIQVGGVFYGTTSGGGASDDGTVFEMTSAGVLNYLVIFTGNGASSAGRLPVGLVEGTDGYLYGVTTAGGTNDEGTIFKTSPVYFNTMVNFTSSGGSYPYAGLVQGPDGNFYGTTSEGGTSYLGTVFQWTGSGPVTTLYDFAADPVDAQPMTSLTLGADGNLYGTTQGTTPGENALGVNGSGAIYRLIFPGTPLVYLNSPNVQNTTSASLTLSANARGALTTVTLQYGTDGVSFPNSVVLSGNLKGYITTPLGTTLTALSPGTTYYYRVSAANSQGTTTTPVSSFSTLEVPAAVAISAVGVSQTSEVLNGTVNAFNYSTSVVFQYSADGGQTFPYAVAATTPVGGSVTGSGATPVSVTINNSSSTPLLPGMTYYYRIVATSVGGTTVSGVQSFTTLTTPMVMATGASLVGTNSAQLNATVDAMGADTTVTFVYGTVTNRVFTAISSPLGAVQGVVPAASTNAVVSVNTSASAPLTQGGTYAYEVTATSAGGTMTTPPVTFQVEVLSGLTQQFPYYAAPSPSTQVYTPLPALASLSVTLIPSASGNYTPGWRLVGEQLWHASGAVVSGLTTGDYEVEYRPTSGYIQPASETVSVTSGTTTVNPTVLTRYYYPTPSAADLSLQIYLYPQNVGSAGGWRLYGASTWNASGATLTGLSPGTYLVECEPVTGQVTPPLASVVVASTTTVVGGVTTVNTATVGQISYSPTNSTSGVKPQPLSFATITSSSTQGKTMPYAYVGQIRSDVGLSSGFAVAPYVVATAAHVVFDDGTLTPNGQGSLGYVTNLQWLFEREAGTYDPVPQTPRGALVLSSYSSDRVADGTPGVSSLTSQNQDVAALYFSTYAGGAGGGYSGYLASDAATNEFLTSTNDKILVGYPVDTEPTSEQGEMFATAAVTNAFTQLSDSSGLLQVYSTSALYSFGGNSGGPLCVQYNGPNGLRYYPAAIYLGESAQSVVRAIDSDVISLFTLAETNGENNENFTGGGTTLVSTTITGGLFGVASIQVNLPGAPTGAGWSLGPIGSGYPVFAGSFNDTNQPSGAYTVYYASVPPYYLTPANFPVTLANGGSYVLNATYEGISGQPANVTAATGASATFTVTTTGMPTSYQWQYVSGSNPPVNVTTGTGANTNTYAISNVTAANAGKYQVLVTWADGSVTSAPATLSVTAPPSYTFTQWLALYGLPANTPLTATPQNDGVTDEMKYLFDIDPTRPMTASDIAALPVVGVSLTNPPYLTLTFREYAYLDSSTTTITVQTATDLTSDNWTTPMGAAILQTTGMPNTSVGDPPPGQTAATDPIMQARVPLTSAGSQFIRLEINSP